MLIVGTLGMLIGKLVLYLRSRHKTVLGDVLGIQS
jgi:hypothetical protein